MAFRQGSCYRDFTVPGTERHIMSTLRIWIPALLVAAGSLLPAQDKPEASTADAASKKAPAGMMIGVVDLAKARETYPKAIKRGQELNTLRESYRATLAEIAKKIDEARENVKALGEGTDEGRQRKFEYDSFIQLHEFQSRRLEESLGVAEMRMQVALYEDMEVAVAKVAKNRGVQVVLRTYDPGPPPTLPDKASPKELREMRQRLQMFDRRQVWFATDESDLTGDLIKLLQVPLEKDQAPIAPAKTEPKPPNKPERGGL